MKGKTITVNTHECVSRPFPLFFFTETSLHTDNIGLNVAQSAIVPIRLNAPQPRCSAVGVRYPRAGPRAYGDDHERQYLPAHRAAFAGNSMSVHTVPCSRAIFAPYPTPPPCLSYQVKRINHVARSPARTSRLSHPANPKNAVNQPQPAGRRRAAGRPAANPRYS